MSAETIDVLDAGTRLRRLLGVLAYLSQVGEADLAELAQRFSVDGRVLVNELELAACCGLPPYTPDALLELIVDAERVRVHGLEALGRPPRLTAEEGFALAAAVRAMLAMPGSDAEGPLASALAKLEAVLGTETVAVEIDAPECLAEVRAAAAAGEAIEIDYLGAKRGDESVRRVEPYAVVAREGRFYLDAFSSEIGDWRRFQVARIRRVRRLGEPVTPRSLPAEFSSARAFVGGRSATTVHVAIDQASSVVVDRFASGPIEHREDGRVVVPIDVAERHFLGRLLLGLGDRAEVIDPLEFADAGREAARRALARYEAPTG
jgi:proteasome accessory factor C